MKRSAIVLVFVTGCSTAPVADVLDYFKPGRIDPGQAAPYGGVCNPKPLGPPAPPPFIPTAIPGVPQFMPGPQGGPMPAPDFGLPGASSRSGPPADSAGPPLGPPG